MHGLSIENFSELLNEYNELCRQYDVNKNGWLSFKDFIIFRTGIGLEKEIKDFKVKERIEDIEGDFEQ